MPRLQALIDETDRWITDHGPVTYDDELFWGEIVLTFKNGERTEKLDIRQTQKVKGRKRNNPSDKRGKGGRL